MYWTAPIGVHEAAAFFRSGRENARQLLLDVSMFIEFIIHATESEYLLDRVYRYLTKEQVV